VLDARVSCIIPVYNGAAFIGEAIESVLTQTFSPIELVVVDDGSEDETNKVVRSFGSAVIYLRQSNAGPAAARNRGVDASSGNYLSFLDADDLWVEDKIERQLAAFRADPTLDYCIGGMENFCQVEEGTPACDEPEGARVKGVVKGYSPVTLLVRRTFFDKVGPFDPAFPDAEDWEWFVRAHDAGGKCHVIETTLTRRRLHGKNRTVGRALELRQALVPVLYASLQRRRGVTRKNTGGSSATASEA
jgi:glycosyltransferase involved in cell wall biosynthesis